MLTRPLLGCALRAIVLRATVGLRSCSGLKTADWILDLGPEGGAEGGRIVTRPVLSRTLQAIAHRAMVGLRSCCGLATGTPEQVAARKASVTGQYLAPYLK